MYAWIWRHLPGPVAVKVFEAAVLVAAVLALLFLIGQVSGEDRISFDLGPFNFQPAELAKFTTLLVLAAYLADERSDEVSSPRFLGGLILVGTPTVLVMLQPDLGSALVLVAMAFGVVAVAGAPLSTGHVAPARLVAPGRRGFWWVKWVTRISVDDVPPWVQPPFPLR